jgi:predicted transcriptional regulator
MKLDINDEIKIRILKRLSDRKVYPFYLLAKKMGANNTTVKKNCTFLRAVGLVKIDEVSPEESASVTRSYRVTITENGLNVVKLMH